MDTTHVTMNYALSYERAPHLYDSTVTAGGRRFRVGHVRLESTIIISKVYNVQYLYSDESSAKCVTHKR